MTKYTYRTHKIKGTIERVIDLDVEPELASVQDDGWEVVSGPSIIEWTYRNPDGVEVPLHDYIFLLRRVDPLHASDSGHAADSGESSTGSAEV